MIRDVVIGYWPVWLFLGGVVLPCALALCRAAAMGDRMIDEALRRRDDELAAREAIRPSPAPIDVEPMR